MNGSDWARAAIICLGAGCFGMITIVLAVYFMVWVRAPRNQRRLPLHIWGIAVAFMIVVADLLLILLNRLGDGVPLSGYAWSFGIAMVIGIYSLFQIAGMQRDRLRGEPQDRP